MDFLSDEILANRQAFEHMGVEKPPPGGWWGVWREDFIAVYPARVHQALEKANFSYATATRSWVERGWLKHGEGTHTYPVSVQGRMHRMVCVLKDVIGELEEGEG